MGFTTTRVLSSLPSGREQVRLAIAMPSGFDATTFRPGQWCELRIAGGEAAPYALVGPPARGELVFLVRAAGDPGTAIAALAPFDAVDVSPLGGAGFDLERTTGRDLAFVATGTGIAPVAAALSAVLARGLEAREISLYYGVRDAAFVALAEELDSFRSAGVRVHVHTSRPDGREPERYVQDLIAAEALDPTRTSFVVAGHPEVAEALRRYAIERGASERVVVENV